MKSDIDLKREVETELRLNPALDATPIAVAVKGGLVSLSGVVKGNSQRWEAERIAKRVSGVNRLVNDIEVRHQLPDPQIARDAVSAVQSKLPYTSQHIRIVVSQGLLTLEGQVEWPYARERAERAVQHIRGVLGVSNRLEVGPRVPPMKIKRRIAESFRQSAELDANRSVQTDVSEAATRGSIRSWAEHGDAKTIV